MNSTQRWSLLVGVNAYDDSSIPALQFCANDARALAALLAGSTESGYAMQRMRTLLSDNHERGATRRNILRSLTDIIGQTSDPDMILFYFSGHGDLIDGEAYILPCDTERGLLLTDTAIPLRRIKQLLKCSRARQKVIIFDACHLGVDLRRRSIDIDEFVRSVGADAEGIAILAASVLNGVSWEDPEKQHGVFTYYLLDALRGAAVQTDERRVTISAVRDYVSHHVLAWSRAHNRMQTPTLTLEASGELELITLPPPGPSQASGSVMLPALTLRERLCSEALLLPIRDRDDFFDFAGDAARVLHALQKGTRCASLLIGPRFAGKTSFINYVQQSLTNDRSTGGRFRHIALNPVAITSWREFARELWDGLIFAIEDDIQHPLPAHLTIFNAETDKAMHARIQALIGTAPGIQFLVTIDEFDKIQHQTGATLDYKRITGLMHYLLQSTELPLAFLLTALRPLPSSRGSDLPTIQRILAPLNPLQTEAFISHMTGGCLRLDPDAQADLYRSTGGWIFLIKLLLRELSVAGVLESEPAHINAGMLHAATQRLVLSSTAVEAINELCSAHVLSSIECRLLQTLATGPEPGMDTTKLDLLAEGHSGARDQMIKDGLITQAGGDHYLLRIGLMRLCVAHWAWETNLIQREGFSVTAQELPAQIAGLCIDMTAHIVYCEGTPLVEQPSNLEYRVLAYLAERLGQIEHTDDVIRHVWGDHGIETSEQALSQVIKRLRQKLGDSDHSILERPRGRGLRLNKVQLIRCPPQTEVPT